MIRISLWSTILQPTIHAVCNVTSISRAQKSAPITQTQITRTQIDEVQITQIQTTRARPAP
jgi:hypothetical protein